MDPLAQLQDIQLPEPIHNYPIAIGWWLLLAILLIAFIFLGFYLYKKKRLNEVRKKALEHLQTTNAIADNIRLIKSTAMAYFPRHEIAALSGATLQQYLVNKLPVKHQDKFNQLAHNGFINVYQKTQSDDNNIDFQQAVKLWLLKALPPTTNSLQNKQRGKV